MMKTQITRYLGSLALAAALLSSTTAAFAAPVNSPSFYDDDQASEEGGFAANGLDYTGTALGVGSGVVDAAAGSTEAGDVTADGLGVGSTVFSGVAAPIVRIATR
jgi:hypothetical protein